MRPSTKIPWTSFRRLTLREVVERCGRTPPPFISQVYLNSRYLVQREDRSTSWGDIVHLFCQRRDFRPHIPWGDLQRIKDSLVGEERVAVEIYPSSDDVVDDANIYHLWCLPRGFDLPFGLRVREEESGKDD